MTPAEIINGLIRHNQRLSEKNDEYLVLAKKRADAELEYRKAVSRTALQMRDDGLPATVIQTMLKGHDRIAKKRFDYLSIFPGHAILGSQLNNPIHVLFKI